jgi:hypothetical protein
VIKAAQRMASDDKWCKNSVLYYYHLAVLVVSVITLQLTTKKL